MASLPAYSYLCGVILLAEEWTGTYSKIEDCYIPGDTLPPCKDEWRTRYYSYFWKVTVYAKKGDKEIQYTPIKADRRPVINGNAIGLFVDEGGDNPRWLFFDFTKAEIAKFRVKTDYILEEETKKGVKVRFRDNEPIQIPDPEAW